MNSMSGVFRNLFRSRTHVATCPKDQVGRKLNPAIHKVLVDEALPDLLFSAAAA